MRLFGKKWMKQAAQVLDLPQDVVLDLPRMTMIGNMQIYIENYRELIYFSNDELRLKLNKGSAEIKGTNLVIRAILSEEIFIEGTILGVKYVPDGGSAGG